MSRLIYAHVFVSVFWWITNLIDFDIRGFFSSSSFFLRLHTCRWEKYLWWTHGMAFSLTPPYAWPSLTPLAIRNDNSRWQNEALAIVSSRASIIIKLLCLLLWSSTAFKVNRSLMPGPLAEGILKSIYHQTTSDHHNFVTLGIRVWWIHVERTKLAPSRESFPITLQKRICFCFYFSLWSHDHVFYTFSYSLAFILWESKPKRRKK